MPGRWLAYGRNVQKHQKKDIRFQLIEDTIVLCKDDKLIIPASLRHMTVSWYHHYLQHPSHSCLEEIITNMMYWKDMCNTIGSHVKSCTSCQKNKRQTKYGHLPPKLVIKTPWRALCADLIGQYTLKGKDGTSIDFMCLTIIDPATSWFEILELLTVTKLTVPNTGKGKKAACILTWENIFPVKVFFLIWVKTLEKYNSQYPSVNGLVQHVLLHTKQQHDEPGHLH